MTTSTQPAWGWLNERWVPAETPELPIRTPKPPESDALSEQNDSDQCDECRCAPGQPHNPECDVSGSPDISCDRKDDNLHDEPSLVTVESCPECGTVTDIEYEDAGPDTFHVPLPVQEFMFEELADAQLEYLHDILNKQSGRILEMARDRFRKGYAKYGSAAYQWDAETRLTNVFEELADSVVYLTTGAVE